VDEGKVTFRVANKGPDDDHEFVVVNTELSPEALPTDETGAVNEEGQGIDVIGEIGEFPPGQDRSKAFDLESGSYVLICNVYDEAEKESHYQQGMRAGFTVE
jgi:hypothetical protein